MKIKKIIKKILFPLSKSDLIYKASKKIIDYHRNENNCDIETNGELSFIEDNKEKFDVIFDVGANVGEWTAFVSKKAPKAKIYSFEPSKQTFQTLSSNKFSNLVTLCNIGLGDKDETKDFFVYGNDSTLNSVFSRDVDIVGLKEKFEIEKASFETLDSFCLKNDINKISFLKIDTEGNELSVLKGAESFIKNGKVDYIQFEYGGTYIDAHILLKDVFDFFKNTPYLIFKMMQNNLKPCEDYSEEFENFQYSNYVVINKNILNK